MTLLISIFAACTATIVWYNKDAANIMRVGTLALIYWGASLMWMIDAVFEFAKLKAAYFSPSFSDTVNDAFLGLSVVALGLVIWIIMIMVKDPKGVWKNNK